MPNKRCKNCNSKIIEYPVYKGLEFDIPLLKGETPGEQFKSLFTFDIPLLKGETPGEKFKSLFTRETASKINWYNLLIGDWTKLLILVSLIFVAIAYMHDTEVCRDIYERPCQFIEKNKKVCTDIIERYTPGIIPNYSRVNFDIDKNIDVKNKRG